MQVVTTCNECLHFEVCNRFTAPNESYPEVGGCRCFKDRSRFVEMPCKVGDTVQHNRQRKGASGMQNKFILVHENGKKHLINLSWVEEIIEDDNGKVIIYFAFSGPDAYEQDCCMPNETLPQIMEQILGKQNGYKQ